MAKPLLFNQLRIIRMYGADFDLQLHDLSSHLNIVFGPNGAGKTTISNALNGLLLPKSVRKFNLYAESDLSYGTKTLHVEIKSDRIECRINGEKVDRQQLSPFIRPKSYHLSLQELLPEITGDSDLAQDIIRQANGGFDITAAGKTLGFERKLRYNKTSEAKNFENAKQKLGAINSDQRALQDQKNQRDTILEELTTAQQAAERFVIIEKIQKWRDATSEYRNAASIADSYPEEIRSSYDLANSVEKAQQLATAINQLGRVIEERRTMIDGIQENLQKNRLTANGLESGELQGLSSQVRDTTEKYRQLEQLKETQEAAQQQAQNAWKKLGGILQPEWEPSFTSDDLTQLQIYAKDYGAYCQEKLALMELKRVFEVLEGEDPTADSNDLRETQQLLQQWILNMESHAPELRMVQPALWTSIALSAVLSLAAGFFLHPLGFSGLLVSILMFWTSQLLRSNMRPKLTEQQKNQLFRLMPDLPRDPDKDSLQSCLTQLVEKRAKVHLEDLKSSELVRIERSLQRLQSRQSEFESREKKITDNLNLSPPDHLTSLIELVGRILDWKEMDQKAKELESRYAITLNNYQTLFASVQTSFSELGYQEPSGPRDAEKLLDQLRQDDDAIKRDHDRLEQENVHLKTTEGQLQDHQLQYDKIFTDLNLRVGDLTELASYARQYADWTVAHKKANELRIRSESLRPDQEIAPEHQWLLEIENLAEELSSAQQQSVHAQRLQEQLTRLDADIERAEKGSSLENALADLETRRAALIQVREEKTAKAVGQVILEQLREDAIKNAPPVFERARQNFYRVTDGRYSLIIPQNDSFRAKDHHRNRDFDLTELSSATRVQLLLSVRLAFVETHETNYRLPLTLDETLANSDDKRAQAIIKTVSTLAADRQVFYFTAQQDEVDKWMDFVPEHQLKVHSIR